MNPDGLKQLGLTPEPISQVPVANVLQIATDRRRSAEIEKNVGELGNQISNLEVQVKQSLDDVKNLKAEADKLNKNADGTQQSTKELQGSIRQTHTLVVVGLYILIFMLVAIIVTVVLYEIQTINQNNQQIIHLLKGSTS